MNKRSNRSAGRSTMLSMLLLSVTAWAGPVLAADQYPSRPLRMVVPFAPGGASDLIARLAQPRLAQELGQQVVIDNLSGASGNIGVEVAAKALPDGYTMLLGCRHHGNQPQHLPQVSGAAGARFHRGDPSR